MELKKNPEVNLENKRLVYFMAGLMFSLGVVLIAFEWTKYEGETQSLGKLQLDLEEEEMIPITQQQPPPPPPPPPQTTIIEIVDDEEELEEELIIEDTELDDDEEIEFMDIPDEEPVAAPEIFTVVEEMPEFPGGEGKLLQYLADNTKYPPIARDAGIQGIVYVKFVVNEKGQIEDDKIEVLRSVHPALDKEAIRVVKSMPDWKPGRQRGKPVNVYFNLPIRFTLR